MAKKKKTPLLSLKSKSVSITGKSTFGNAKITKGQGSLAASPAGMLPSKQTRRIIRTHHTLLKQQAIIQKDIEKEVAQIKRNNLSSGKNNKHVSEEQTITSEKLTELQNSLESIHKQIEENGGIEVYQKASISGQDSSRGGDTSKILIEWLQELGISGQKTLKKKSSETENKPKLSLLEVGSLSSKNACSISGVFDYIERIDLNSQDPKYIKEQDFMQRPLPKKSALAQENTTEPEVFDLISLSLVVNYVSDPQTRGRMLLRSTEFLKKQTVSRKNGNAFQSKSHIKFNDTGDISTESTGEGQKKEPRYKEIFPCLFFVLPAPCVTNSRYLTEEHLTNIMNSIGYTKLLKHKVSNKLAYWLWKFGDPLDQTDEPFRMSPYVQKELNIMKNQSFNGAPSNDTLEKHAKKLFSKKEVNPGGGRNNFAITL